MRLLVVACLFLSGCAHSIHGVYISDFGSYPKLEQGNMIKATAEQFTIMGFVYETDYVDKARKKLIAQCPNGEITGISTQFSTSLGFFSWTHKVLMQGLCAMPTAKSAQASTADLHRKNQ